MLANGWGQVRLALLLSCALLAPPLLPFTLITDFWEMHGYASGKASVLLFDLPQDSVSEQEQLNASYQAGLETRFYLDTFSFTASGSYFSEESFSLDEAYWGWGANSFDVSLGKQRTVWGFGSFFHPSYALELKEGKNAEFPSGATLWSAILNIPFDEAQLSIFGYLENEFLEAVRAPGWGGTSAVLQTGVDVFELSFSGSALVGSSINNKINLAAEMRIDLGLGYILSGSFGSVINLESRLHRYTPSGLLGVSFSSSDGKQQFTLEGYYDKGLFLASRLAMQLLSGFNGSVLLHMDMENRGLRLSASINFSPSGYFSTAFNLSYFNGRTGSRFDNNGVPLVMELSFSFSF